jgi:hypothetical protein
MAFVNQPKVFVTSKIITTNISVKRMGLWLDENREMHAGADRLDTSRDAYAEGLNSVVSIQLTFMVVIPLCFRYRPTELSQSKQNSNLCSKVLRHMF